MIIEQTALSRTHLRYYYYALALSLNRQNIIHGHGFIDTECKAHHPETHFQAHTPEKLLEMAKLLKIVLHGADLRQT